MGIAHACLRHGGRHHFARGNACNALQSESFCGKPFLSRGRRSSFVQRRYPASSCTTTPLRSPFLTPAASSHRTRRGRPLRWSPARPARTPLMPFVFDLPADAALSRLPFVLGRFPPDGQVARRRTHTSLSAERGLHSALLPPSPHRFLSRQRCVSSTPHYLYPHS